MKVNRITISNFKGITHIDLEKLGDTVVIAGPNGCGKSSIFDAIRLWKTAYGGYAANEMQSWYGEHGLSLGQDSLRSLLQNQNDQMSIYAEIAFSESERTWMRANAKSILRTVAFRKKSPDYAMEWKSFGEVPLSDVLQSHSRAVEKEVEANIENFLVELDNDGVGGMLSYSDGEGVKKTPSTLLSNVFTIYDPDNLGKFDYHGPQRSYGRENVGSINLQVEQHAQQRQQHALYHSSGKYSNVKTELASAYVRDLISKEYTAATGTEPEPASLVDTVKEMFDKFFPGKEFLGVQSQSKGRLSFEVKTAVGNHDLGDLSSGEKELIYGYLRLKNEAPRNSVIMFDEPELHLNPRLTDGLPEFYHRHIGQALGNQLWLITHSDSILRQAVGREKFSVFHMQKAGAYDGDHQAIELSAETPLHRAIFDLVGDLASYAPAAKTVFLEGGGMSEFDRTFVQDLFPDFSNRCNIISSGNKQKVRDVHELLEIARSAGATTSRFYSITDKDDGQDIVTLPGKTFSWDRFHIENYLLEELFIREVMVDLGVQGSKSLTDENVLDMLRTSAAETTDRLVQHEIERSTELSMKQAIKVNSRRDAEFDPQQLRHLIEASAKNLAEIVAELLEDDTIVQKTEEVRRLKEQELTSELWKMSFRGRDVLKRFSHSHLSGVDYEKFRNLILSKMRNAKFQPVGMSAVISQIESD